jgi:tetratricopeptide (TPR) repeat protein
VVYGELFGTSGDSSRIRASLVETATGRGVAQVERRDANARLDQMMDSVSVELLRALSQTRAIAAVRHHSIGASSMTALKAFLHGEQLFRRNDYTGARRSYERALAIDTNFALAHRRMRSVLRAIGQEADSLSYWYALAAGRRNHGLSPRDSLLITADSLAASIPRATIYEPADLARLRRRLVTLRDAATRFADDPEIWMELGEVVFHYGDRLGQPRDSALAAFERAITLDSAFFPAMYHAVELALPLRGVDSARRLIERFPGLTRTDSRYALVTRFLSSNADDRTRATAEVPRLPVRDVYHAAGLLRLWDDSAATALALYDELRGRPSDVFEVRDSRTKSALLLLRRGRFREAVDPEHHAGITSIPQHYVALALTGAARDSAVTSMVQAWARSADLLSLRAAIVWAGERGDTLLLVATNRQLDRLRHAPDSASSALAYVVHLQRAFDALARRDSAVALERFLALPDSLVNWTAWLERATTARLLSAAGRPRESLERLRRHPMPGAATTPFEALWLRETGNAARALGDTALATAMEHGLDLMWRTADAQVRRTSSIP